MIINPKIFKAYDIRSIFGQELDIEGGVKVMQTIVDYFVSQFEKDKRLTVNVGHDMRAESILLYEQVQSALAKYDIDCNLLGNIPTTTAYFGIFHTKADAAIQITASHNPGGYLGIKPFYRQGEAIIKVSGIAIRDFLENKQVSSPSGQAEFKTITNIIDIECLQSVEKYFPSKQKFRVGVDTANGMGVKFWQSLEKILPLEIHYLNSELDGTFPAHLSDTLQLQFWKDLQKLVKEQKLDLGVATDGDGDRIAVIGEDGEFINNSLLTCILIKSLYETSRIKSTQVDIRSVNNVKNLCDKLRVKLVVGNVGHALITKTMNEEKIDFSGESSGHYFFSSRGGAESIVDVITLLLEEMANSKQTLSELAKNMRSSIEIAETNFKIGENMTKEEIFAALKSDENEAIVSTLDGITFDYPTYRYNVRGSNTEPLLRLNLEGNTPDIVQTQTARIINRLEQLGCVLASGH